MTDGDPRRTAGRQRGGASTRAQAEAFAESMREEVYPLHAQGVSYGSIARYLNNRGLFTQRGKEWTAQGVKNLIARLDALQPPPPPDPDQGLRRHTSLLISKLLEGDAFDPEYEALRLNEYMRHFDTTLDGSSYWTADKVLDAVAKLKALYPDDESRQALLERHRGFTRRYPLPELEWQHQEHIDTSTGRIKRRLVQVRNEPPEPREQHKARLKWLESERAVGPRMTDHDAWRLRRRTWRVIDRLYMQGKRDEANAMRIELNRRMHAHFRASGRRYLDGTE